MAPKTIKNCGKVEIFDWLQETNGSRIARDFLNKLMVAFVKKSSTYMRLIGETPFAFGEIQSHSIFAPSLSTFVEAFFMELPTRRTNKKLKLESNGRIDYWASIEKQTSTLN